MSAAYLLHTSTSAFPATKVWPVLEKALNGEALSRATLVRLAELSEHSLESGLVRAVADTVTRRRFGNKAMLLWQAGVESHPCPADCAFCGFGQSQFTGQPQRMDDENLDRLAGEAAASERLYAFFLMYMHTYDFETVLRTVSRMRRRLPRSKEVVVNMGDFDRVQAQELRSAGADGAYHVLRLGEGKDTRLEPAARLRTIEHTVNAGLHWYTCCEPIGPEHSPEVLVEQMLTGRHLRCFQHAAMRRVPVPGTSLAVHGQISSLRLAHLVAVTTLAMADNPQLGSIAVHEPDMVGLVSGANCVYAEFGGNPRDREQDTRSGRGHSLAQCEQMLAEAGFEGFIQAFSHVNAQ